MIIPPFKKGIPINKVNLVCHIPKVQVDTVYGRVLHFKPRSPDILATLTKMKKLKFCVSAQNVALFYITFSDKSSPNQGY